MKPVRCPKCGRLLGYFDGRGEIICTRCRKDAKVYFDTEAKIIELRNKERI